MAELDDKVFVFTGATLEAALAEWEAEQVATYPHREELIRTVALAMRDFMGSQVVRRHKMIMKADG